MHLNIDNNLCIGCGLCKTVCIRDNIKIEDVAIEQDSGTCFDCCHCMAICPTGAITVKKFENQMDKVEKYESSSPKVNSEEFMDLLKHRRSTRWFKDKKIDKETFDKLFEAAYYSPNKQNIQDVEFVVIEDKLDEFIQLVYDIIKVDEDKFFRIKQVGDYLKNPEAYENHPLLWEGKQLIVGFSTDATSTHVAAARIELLGYTMGIGGFYSFFILKADEIDHDRLMEFFPEIDSKKHMYSTYILGYPRVTYQRSVPHEEIKVTYK